MAPGERRQRGERSGQGGCEEALQSESRGMDDRGEI